MIDLAADQAEIEAAAPFRQVFECTAYIEPHAKMAPRARRGAEGRPQTYRDPRDADEERSLRQWIRDALPAAFVTFNVPVRLLITAHRSPTQAVAAKLARGRVVPPPATKPDVGNLVKFVEDALTGLVYADDALVVECWVRKCWAADLRPRWHIRVTPA